MPNEVTDVRINAQARRKILSGVNKVFHAVRLTLGPEGRNALLPRSWNRGPRITNDGITIMENARLLKDPHERLAAEAYTEGSKKTNELVGDGTTTTAVIAGHLLNQVFGQLSDQDTPAANLPGQNQPLRKGVRTIRREMRDAKELVIEKIKEHAKPIKSLADLKKIAMVSVGREDDAIAETVAQMVWDVARLEDGTYVDNYIEVTESHRGETETEITRGMRFPSKVAHRAFINKPERFEMVANDVMVFITNYKLDNAYMVVDLLNRLKAGKIAIFAPDFSPMVITSLIETSKNGLFCYPVKCPALRTEQLEDLAVYTGATVIDKDTGKKIETSSVADLGFAAEIVVKATEAREDAVLLGGRGEKIKRGQGNLITERAEVLRGQLEDAKNAVAKGQLEKRIANLASAVGVIRVGASTNAELLFLKLKVEDGVYACKAALQEGYVEGGGLCLKKIAESLPENILTESLKTPHEQIQRNAGGIMEIGKEIIDPAKVVRLEVEHAVSVASQIITADISIPTVGDKSPADGYEMIARAIAKGVFYQAKHQGMLQESEAEAEKDRQEKFEEAMFNDQG